MHEVIKGLFVLSAGKAIYIQSIQSQRFSYFIEKLTDEIGQKSWKLFLDKMDSSI